jgi:chemotaxis protein methyltransferase CheR
VSLSVVESVLEELRRVRGVDLSGYCRSTLKRRLASRMDSLHLNDPLEYLGRLQSDPDESDRLIETITIKVSSFFRDPFVFGFIAQRVLPQIMERHRRERDHQLRVWSAGCATGEEAYSVAILLAQALETENFPWLPYICATDISIAALETAKTGRYHRGSFATTTLGVLDRYFKPTLEGFEVIPALRHLVHFSKDCLTSGNGLAPTDSIYGSFDLVLCRNVLMYYSLDLQRGTLDRLYEVLNPGGYLVLGASESLPLQSASRLMAIDQPNRIFQKS